MATTRNAKGERPSKPYVGFPLFAHSNGLWAKKIRGRQRYFGPWRDWRKALERYEQQRDYLYTGRRPPPGGGLTVRALVNDFLSKKRGLVDTGELAARTWQDYHTACAKVVKCFGPERLVEDLRPDDFRKLRVQLAQGRGLVALAGDIGRIKVCFKHAHDNGLIERPAKYGTDFKRPNKAALRKEKNSKGKRMFEAAELRAMLDAAGPALKAMILLGINCGFGNGDCGGLPMAAVNLDTGWIDYPRPKTGNHRRIPLWPETVKAIEAAIGARPAPKSKTDGRLVFLTSQGRPWQKSKTIPKVQQTNEAGEEVEVDGQVVADNPISKETRKLLVKLDLYRPGLNFYALRHTFRTIGKRARDAEALKELMGHTPPANDMAASYDEEPCEDARLQAVVEHVRKWLFAPAKS